MNYSRSDIEHMREDALRRTREMHSRARPESKEKSGIHEEYYNGVQAEPNNSDSHDIFGSLLPNMKVDGDKLLLILLIIILSKEGADLKLLIALGYILI